MSNPAEAQAELEARLREFVGKETGPPSTGPDPVNTAMIRHWCDAMGDANPVYTDPEQAEASLHGGIVAPPTMMQAWILPGMRMAEVRAGTRDLQNSIHDLLTESGYPSVVATNCEQEYDRYLRPGDAVEARTVIESVSEQKATALGVGYFIDTRTTFLVDGEEVGRMLFRVLKFRPHAPPPATEGESAAPAAPRRLRPTLGHDNKWWWDAVDAGKLLIQRCKSCQALRHPPRPMCGECQSMEWDSIESTMEGEVMSHTELHHPKIPGYPSPLTCAVIRLAEGTHFVANVVGCDGADVHIGMKVKGKIEQVDEKTTLPQFYPA